MNPISHFQQLLQEAAAQTEPQRLLFVFAAAELPKGATLAQRERYLAGEGGALAPLMCVDKAPVELEDFAGRPAAVKSRDRHGADVDG
jgi:hypothetical protein